MFRLRRAFQDDFVTEFDALLAKHDPDRRLAALFAPAPVRARLFALYAFHHEIAKIPDAVSEPVIGEMRLAWAREAVSDLFAAPPKVRRHDIYEALAGLIAAPGGPTAEELDDLIEVRAADLGQGGFPDAQERLAYVDRTAGAAMRLAARLCAPDLDLGGRTGQALAAAGRLWGFTGLVEAFTALCAAGRPPLTEADMENAGLTEAQAQKGLNPQGAKAALAGLIAEADAARADLTETRGGLPAEIFPAVGYAALAKSRLDRARRNADPYQPSAPPRLLSHQARLVLGSLTGRI